MTEPAWAAHFDRDPFAPVWEYEVELADGTSRRHGWIDDHDALRVGALLRLDGEREWWQVRRILGRREVVVCQGLTD